MHRTPKRLIAFAALIGLVAVLPAAGKQVVVAQVQVAQPVPVAPGQPADGKTKTQSINVMTFPTDRDAKQMIEAVQQYLVEFKEKEDKAPWDKICLAAQNVLDSKSDSFFEVAKKGDDSGKFHGVSAKAEANRLIARFPAVGRQFYQLAQGATAEAQLRTAVNAGYDRAGLADVSLRYFHTKAGAQATLLLAGYHLERGNFTEAAYSFERLMDRPDADEFLTPRVAFKAFVALKRGGSQQTEAMKTLWDRVEKKYPRDGLTFGRKSYSLEELKAEADRNFDTLFGRVGDGYLATRFGNPSHTSLSDGGVPFLDPVEKPKPMAYLTGEFYADGTTWINQNLADVLKNINPAKNEVAIPGFFPVTTPNLFVYRTYDGVYAMITKDGFSNHGTPAKAGDLYWISRTAGSLNQMMGSEKKEDAKNWWNTYRTMQQTSILFENPLVGSLAHDGQNVYLVDDQAIPQPGQQNANDFGMGMPQVTASVADGSRLRAVNLETGKIDWELGVPVPGPPLNDDDEDKTTNPLLLTQGAYFLGPPLPLNGKLYVLFERNGRMRLMCLDGTKVQLHNNTLRHPEMLWTQRLGEPNTRLPLDTHRRYQCSYLAYADGVMICPTNAGAVVAVDIMSRSLVWAQSYRFIKAAAQLTNPGMGRRVGVMPNAGGGASVLSPDRWRSAAPILARGRVVFAAYDCEAVNCLDLRTGALLWSEPRRAGDLYVGGLVDDRVVIVSKDSVRAVNLVGDPDPKPTPDGAKEIVKVAFKALRIGVPAGHGVATKAGIYYVPLATTPEGTTPEVWGIDVKAGTVVSKTPYRKTDATSEAKPTLGNLAFHEGQMFSQSPTEIAVFPLVELKKKKMDELLRANPRDPDGLVARGEMSLSEGKLQEAIADIKEAEKHKPSAALQARMREKLYQTYTELLRRDFAAGENLLAEYERLIEVPLDTDDPNQRQRIADEQFRRRGLYLCLLAKGREKQGRIAEAFDRYREFAALGGGKQLVAIHDEPNGTTRPDVWARGRIEQMVRAAKDPAVRKPLETRVAAEWDAVKVANDLARLRDFVKVFGPYFAAGRDGQMLLATRLSETNNEDNTREAQSLLMQLWATADDRGTAARAVEALARLMTKNGLPEDAVGLYTQLGTTYPDVVVRDGKTGADFLNDLLTDKRLLPYLEPTRISTPNKIKVEQTAGGVVSGVPTGFTFEPEGELLPFFRRYRLSLANDNSGNGGWTMRVTDRNTGVERGKFANIKLFTPNGSPPFRLGAVNGHLLLLHLGHVVYCFDLAENKELWQYNLLGANSRVDFNNVQYEQAADGSTLVSYLPEGLKLRLGRSAVLEPTYACLLSRDGLVAVDPATGGELWKRSNVSLSAQVFGDANNVYVVETNGSDKPRSRVLRAVDGTPVEGVPDFAAAFTDKGKIRVIGRQILLFDAPAGKPAAARLYDPLTGKDAWKRDYPAGTKLADCVTGDFLGLIDPAGKFDVLEPRAGKVLFTGNVDKDRLAAVTAAATPVLMHDSDRFYLALNTQPRQTGQNYYGYMPLRQTTLTGPLFCFDRATGKRLWYTDELFKNQSIFVERFAEMPALVAATQTNEDGSNMSVYKVIAVDKRNGKIRFLKGLINGGAFYTMSTDPKTGTFKFLRGDLSVAISPDETPEKTAAK